MGIHNFCYGMININVVQLCNFLHNKDVFHARLFFRVNGVRKADMNPSPIAANRGGVMIVEKLAF